MPPLSGKSGNLSLLSVKSGNQLIREQSRLEQDIAEIGNAHQPHPAPGAFVPSTRLLTDDEALDGLMVTEPARRKAEVAVAATVFIFVALAALPSDLKKGQAWYSVCHGVVLFSTVVSARWYFGNMHVKLLRFLTVNGVFWQVVVLAVVDWARDIVWRDVGWEVSGRLGASTTLIFRLAFFSQDALKGVSRWCRVFTAALFLFGNLTAMVKAYFLDTPIAIYTIHATNTTITTTGIKAGVGTTMFSLTLTAIINVWNDPAFQYFSLVQSFLPKLVVDAEGLELGSRQKKLLLEEHEAAKVAWRGWPKKGAVAVLVSILVYVAARTNENDDGSESTLILGLRSAALFLLISGSGFFFFNNISWPRLKYTFTCPQGVLWVFYVTVYFVVHMAKPDQAAPISNALAATYSSLGFLLWFTMESAKNVSQAMRFSLTLLTALTLALAYYMSVYVWQADQFLVDLNPVVPGVLTKYYVLRIAWINLGLLMAGSLYTVIFDTEGKYMVLVSGYVSRKEVLELKSVFDLVVGDSEGEVENAEENFDRLRTHSRLSTVCQQQLVQK